MVEHALQHFIYGNAVIANQATDTLDLLARSEHINSNSDQIQQFLAAVPISPLPAVKASQSVAMVFCRIDNTAYYILARANKHPLDPTLTLRQLVLIPQAEITNYNNFEALVALFNEPIPIYNVTNTIVEPLEITLIEPPSKDKQVMILKSLLEDVFQDNFQHLIAILNRAIQNKIVIRNFPFDHNARLLLMRGLRLLLPQSLRSMLTFTSYTDTLSEDLPRVSFSNQDTETSANIIDWNTLADLQGTLHLYIQQLDSQWEDNVIALVDRIARYDEILQGLDQGSSTLQKRLTMIADRYQLDRAALTGDALHTEQILAVFESDIPMSIELQTAYAILLLENNFENRDTVTAQTIATVLQDNEVLNENLQPFLNSSIEEQPDAVYAFVRTHLHTIDDEQLNDLWLTRLHDAAQQSVTVAIESKNTETIRSWLILISREPLRYQLNDILQNAIISAKPFVTDNPELAQELLAVAVKRQPDMLNDLLSDELVLAAIPNYLTQALIDHDASAIEALPTESRDLFLLALYRAIEAQVSAVTTISIRALWQIHTQQQTNTLPAQFRPLSLIQSLIENPHCFTNGAYTTLLTLSLADGSQDDIFFAAMPLLAEQDNIAEAFAQSLDQSNRSPDTILDILSTLLGSDAITPQLAVLALSTLLINRNWDESTTPFVEQLARLMSQHPDVDASVGVLWKLSELSAEYKNEQMLKVSQRRLLDVTGNLVAEAQIVDNIKTIRADSQWSAIGKTTLVKWWRNFARQQGLGQLQKIDKLLEGNRTLEDLRAIIQTTIAMRRIIGNRTLEEFSDVIATTYTLLQALSEGFDPSDKLVDSTTIRNEIEARTDELPVALRPVLSTNLRELAQLVTTLSENRIKPSLIRSDDMVERQLVKGEQEPQSAIDVMRWLSGYLDGIQKDDD